MSGYITTPNRSTLLCACVPSGLLLMLNLRRTLLIGSGECIVRPKIFAGPLGQFVNKLTNIQSNTDNLKLSGFNLSGADCLYKNININDLNSQVCFG